MKPLRGLTVSLGVVAVVVAIGAVAQTPPRYVDERDSDSQPFYVDGVEYTPYVNGRRQNQNQNQRQNQAQIQPITVVTEPQYLPGELRPYVPVQPQAPSPSAPTSVSGPQASDSASGSSSVSVASSPSRSAEDASSASSSSSSKDEPVTQRPRYGSAVIEVLDKVTAESIRFEAPIGKPLRYKSLVYTVRACETSAADEAMQDVFAYIQIRTAPDQAQSATLFKSREVFRGWSFASSPSLNPVQHANYDAWVVGCRHPLPA